MYCLDGEFKPRDIDVYIILVSFAKPYTSLYQQIKIRL